MTKAPVFTTMIKSIRWRLALASVSVWAVILVASAAAVYSWAEHQLRAQLDRGLISCLQVVGQSLTHEVQEHGSPAAGEKQIADLLVTLHQQSFPRQAVAVFQDARLVAQKKGDSDLTLDPVAPPVAPGGLQFASRVIGRTPARVAIRRLQEEGIRYTVVAAEPEANLELALTSLRSALLLLVSLAILLSVGVGYALARGALRPVIHMAEAVDRIHAGNLSQRIESPNPGDELGHLGAVFNRLLSRLDRSFEQEKQFMADASHELRTPLSVSLLAAQVALDRPRSGEEYREALSTIRSQLERLARLVRNLLTLARSDAGAFQLQGSLCRLDELVLEAVHTGSVLARPKEIRLRIGDLPEAQVSADPELLRQVIVILLDNAVKYSPSRTTVNISLREVAGYCELDVQDQGCGIPPAAQTRIFDRFFRVEPSRSRNTGGTVAGEGTGLGLPIAQLIVRAHEGTVTLFDSSPAGSTFRVRLPLATPTFQRPDAERSKPVRVS